MIIHRRVGLVCAALIAMLVWSMIVFPSCNEAAASPIALYDTTKPQIKKNTPLTINRYTLTGTDTLFLILVNQVYSPEDVTPRNLQKLKLWLNTIRLDTTTNYQK